MERTDLPFNQILEREIEDRRQEHAELEKQATTDALTGLYNRWHLFTLGQYELEKCRLGLPCHMRRQYRGLGRNYWG